MGHDIEIKDECGDVVGSTGVSFNFGEESDKYGGIYKMHGKTGAEVVKIARDVIRKMERDGFVMGTRDPENLNWAWGLQKNNPSHDMDFQEHAGVYMYHMNRFVELGNRFPDYRFYSDQVFATESDDDSDVDSDDDIMDLGMDSVGELERKFTKISTETLDLLVRAGMRELSQRRRKNL